MKYSNNDIHASINHNCKFITEEDKDKENLARQRNLLL